MLEILLTTFLKRPYVFAFLISFLVIGILNRGWKRTLIFLTCGFSLAWVSEYSSIRNAFPYGWYFYVYENMKNEWMLGSVPVWDSLSYSFLAYAAYEYGDYFLRDRLKDKLAFRIIIYSLLMVAIDIVVDPLAVRGEKWFLGHIFYYPNGGQYFGVPLTNFAGWILVALAIISSFEFLQRKISDKLPLRFPILGPAFYWGILTFNFLITFWIGEWKLGITGLIFQLSILASLARVSSRNSLPSKE